MEFQLNERTAPQIRTQFALMDRLCGMALRVPGCRTRGPGFDSWRSVEDGILYGHRVEIFTA
jgi:hypothetical protein